MMLTSDELSALPLWINGHAFLTMADEFMTVVQPSTGKSLRRVPLCGSSEIAQAIAPMEAAAADWSATPRTVCHEKLFILQQDLARYRPHFVKLLDEESSMGTDAAERAIDHALTALSTPESLNVTCGITAILMDASQAFGEPVAALAQALAAGQCVLLKTSPKVPSALFAFAELCTRAGFPSSTVNLVHGDTAAVDAIAQHPAITRIVFCGEPALRETIQQRLTTFHKTLAT